MSIILNLKSLIQTTILRHGGWIGECAADWIVRYGKIKKKWTQEITKENLKITCVVKCENITKIVSFLQG